MLDLEDGWMWASTEMGEVKVVGEDERCNVGHGQMFVDVGNPHLVVLGPDPARSTSLRSARRSAREAGAADRRRQRRVRGPRPGP